MSALPGKDEAPWVGLRKAADKGDARGWRTFPAEARRLADHLEAEAAAKAGAVR